MIGETGKSPLGSGRHIVTGIQDSEIFLPEQLAIQVIVEEPFGPEEHDKVPAVGGGSWVGVGRFRMPHDFGRTARRSPLPQNLPGLAIQAINLEALRGFTLNRFDISI